MDVYKKNENGEIENKFGFQKITDDLKERIEKIAESRSMGLHPFFENGLFSSHRDLEKILDHFENGKPFYIYTGRGPSSSSLHLGHLVPFIMTKYLQDLFQVPVIIQITDDEKYYNSEKEKGMSSPKLEDFQKNAKENIKDIISIGFNQDQTYIFQNTLDIDLLYSEIVKINKIVNLNQVQHVFGSKDSDSLGKVSFPISQIAPSFAQTFKSIFPSDININEVMCLIPCAIDQDPYFRLTRDLAPKLGYLKPCLIYSEFFLSLFGNLKMSSSAKNTNSVIFIDETPKQVISKINKYAFSGGKDTLEEHRKYGGNPDIDVCCQYLKYLLDDKPRYETILSAYRAGHLLSGELKKITSDIINQILKEYQNLRKSVKNDVYKNYTSRKILRF